MLAAIALVGVLLPVADGSEILFQSSRLTCRDWAVVANSYIQVGEEEALTEIRKSLALSRYSKAGTRVGLLCRILYPSKGKGPLRAPRFGALSLPPMPLGAWPEYPMLQQDGVWFELDENYRLGGEAEAVSSYIDYCQKEGKFRAEKVMVPTRQQALDALRALQSSKRWNAIRWSGGDLRSSYTYASDWTLDLLRSQCRFPDSP